MLESLDNSGSRVEAAVARLAKLVMARFSCNLRYVPFDAANDSHSGLRRKLLREAPLEHNGAWLFPVFNCYQILGYAEVTGVLKTTAEQRRQLADLVELYLESTLAMADKLETLNQIESQITRSGDDYGGSNVIPLRRQGSEPARALSVKARPRLGFALPCLIEAPTYTDLKAMAMELHELSGRYAFVYGQDVTWKFAEDLKDLGPVTLYIPEITKLAMPEQLKLQKYLSSSPSVDEPQIIAGTLKAYSAVRSEELMIPDLLHRLSVCYLRMDRPFAEYRREGIVEFFFGSLVRDDLKGRLV